MKYLITTLTLLLSFHSYSQGTISGRYIDNFGSTLSLNTDSSFKYTWHFDLSISWTKGKWSFSNDTIYLIATSIIDTIQYTNESGETIDTLLLSTDETPSRIVIKTRNEFPWYLGSSKTQNSQPYPDKLFYKKDRLYEIKDGKLIKKKQRGFWTKKKFAPWYYKSDER